MIVMQRRGRLACFTAAILLAGIASAMAAPSLVVDVDSGAVLHQEDATASWYPASLTKLMTAYVALRAVKDGKITLDTPLVVSARAARMAPSKMGFRPGTIVTLDNALKMLMVKSANDIAVTIAEGVSGSVEAFADAMNAEATELGMHESYFENPNGLPSERQVMSARDIAVVARALFTEFPEQRGLFGIGELQLGPQIIETHNGLLGRYPGADGMKTGFTCAAGFNIVASATQGGRHLIAVVLGGSTVRERNFKAAQLLDAGFSASELGAGDLQSLPPAGIRPAPNRRAEACGRHPKTEALGEDAEAASSPPAGRAPAMGSDAPAGASFLSALLPHPAGPSGAMVMLAQQHERPHFDPVPVYIGPAPGWTGPIPNAPPAAVAGMGRKPAAQGPTPETAAAYAATEKPKADAVAAATAAAGPAALSGATDLRPPQTKGKRKAVRRAKPKPVPKIVPVKAPAKAASRRPSAKTVPDKPSAKAVPEKAAAKAVPKKASAKVVRIEAPARPAQTKALKKRQAAVQPSKS